MAKEFLALSAYETQQIHHLEEITLGFGLYNKNDNVRSKSLSSDSRQMLGEMQHGSSSDVPVVNDIDADDNDEWETVPEAPDESLGHAARDMMDSRFHRQYHVDHRTWRQRLQRRHQNWKPLMEDLVDAFLIWKYSIDVADKPIDPDSEITADTGDEPMEPDSLDIEIDVIDLYTLDRRVTIPRSNNVRTAIAMARAGYLGVSPEAPQLVLSFRTLELYHRIRRRKPSFSIEAFAKVLCDLYTIPYTRRYRDGLSNVFDVYLEVLRIIDSRISKELGRDTENWRVLNACPPCSYELENEPPLRFSRMFVLDGNNSLKRVQNAGDRFVGDLRTFEGSDYYLSEDFVEKYANEVKKRPPVTTDTSYDGPDDDEAPSTNDPVSGDPTDGVSPDGTPIYSQCADNWKAADNQANKKMWAIFDESGVFASACRHGFILWLVDMVRSGELAKYPLAIIAKALDILPPRFLSAYDIGCVFGGTIARSSLGPLFAQRGSRCCVNAFHGYSHNFLCQLQHHPNSIEGMGLEDLETLERVFSSSNQLGSVTRYMSKYRRRVYVDLFFRQWDEEKYENLGTMIFNNYQQALEIIQVDGPELDRAKAELNVSDDDLKRWLDEQKQYFMTLGNEPEGQTLKVAYVERLRELREAEEKYKSANNRFMIDTPEDASHATYASELSAMRKRETERRYADERRDQLTRDVTMLEERLGISQRWSFSSPEFLETARYINQRKYEQCLDKLQKLVVQRLFELQKLNLSYTAYKMRSHIAKSLQARCKAIRSAVAAYNKAALELDPPRPTLDWSRVSHYTFLQDFALLRNTNRDIADRPWTQLVHREMIKQDQKVKRAQEEILRCNVEVRRLHTSIVDEEAFFKTRLPEIQASKSLTYGAILDFATRRRRVNAKLLSRIAQIYSLRGFTGTVGHGLRKGAMCREDSEGQNSEVHNFVDDEGTGGILDGEDEDDDDIATLDNIVEFIGNL
ncbi:hypothetical protein H0H92_001927 [Tricholoma furcatifolium]|nr:hypothetical protein H0H92_001927 [Tricholoma furcatifolium]